jgi:predicted branched-subunit amino acid permease
MAQRRHAEGGTDEETRAYYVGAATCLLAGWTAIVTTGVVLGTRLPSLATLDVVAPLALLALVIGQLDDGAARVAAAVAVAVALAGAGLPAGVPVLLAMGAGAAAGAARGGSS